MRKEFSQEDVNRIIKYQADTLSFVFKSIVNMYGDSEQDQKAEQGIKEQEKNNYFK